MAGSDQPDNRSSVGLRWTPQTEAERKSVREELARLLADPLFRNSKRYPSFLQYVVEQTLNGQGEFLKERTVGSEVFGRPPDYDTNVDHMVRNVAVEVRKRLAEYYETSDPKAPLRIEIPAGAYVPQFRIAEPETSAPASGAARSASALSVVHPEELTLAAPPARRRIQRKWLIAGGIAVGVAAAALWLWGALGRTATDRFWGPVWADSAPLVLCIAGPEGFPLEPGPDVPRPESLLDFQRSRSLVTFSDSLTLLRMAALVQAHGKDYRVLYSRDSRVSDLTSGSAVLIGTGDDELIRLLSAPLRFHFKHEGSSSYIVDSQDPKRTDWAVNWLTPYNQLTNDYAIVWRVRGQYTGKYVVGVAGITRLAVAGTGQLLVSPEGLAALERATHGAWNEKNVEIVLRIQADRGSPFPPEVIATHVW